MGKERKPLKPNSKGGNPAWTKGVSGNPGGMTAKEAEARGKLRAALCGEWEEIHEALMKLVKSGNAPAVIYAHKHVAGEVLAAQTRDEDEDSGLDALTNDEARDYLALCLKVSDAAKTKALAQATHQSAH